MPEPLVSVRNSVAKADQPPRGNFELEIDAARAVVGQVEHATAAYAQLLRHDADEIIGHVEKKLLDRFVAFAVDLAW